MILFHASPDEDALIYQLSGRNSGALIGEGNAWNVPFLWGIDGNELVWFDWGADSIHRFDLLLMADSSRPNEDKILSTNRQLDQIVNIFGHGICVVNDQPRGFDLYPGHFGALRMNILRILIDTKLDADSILKGLKSLGIDLTGAGWKLQRNFISKGIQFQKLAEGSTAEEFIREAFGEIDITNVKPREF